MDATKGDSEELQYQEFLNWQLSAICREVCWLQYFNRFPLEKSKMAKMMVALQEISQALNNLIAMCESSADSTSADLYGRFETEEQNVQQLMTENNGSLVTNGRFQANAHEYTK